MRVSEKAVQIQVALALAHLCAPDDRKAIFIDSDGNNVSHIFKHCVIFGIQVYFTGPILMGFSSANFLPHIHFFCRFRVDA